MNFHKAILYNDDSLCIRYKDGSVLQLSPCASAFRFHASSSSKSSHVQQLSRFAVSTYRKPVVSAIFSRNQFACHPYLCKELLNKENIIVRKSSFIQYSNIFPIVISMLYHTYYGCTICSNHCILNSGIISF